MTVRRAVLAVMLLAYAALYAVLLHVDDLEHRDIWLYGLALPSFALAVVLLRISALRGQGAVFAVLGVGVLLQLIALTRSPQTSDDAARYVWDAKVQLDGTDPYRYPPAAQQLAPLREPDLFGTTSSCAHPLPHSCTAINRPTSRTIYPPVAQLAFDVTRIASGGRSFLLPYQVIAALGAILTTLLLLRWRPPWQAALWAWCPLVVLELGNNAHIDWLAAVLAVLALRASASGRDVRAALLLGAAIATKLYPALLLPVLMRRRPWLTAGVALGFVVVSYVPHLLAVGTDIVGYLPGYLREEGYDSGDRLLLLGRVLPHPLDTVAAAAILLSVAWWAWRRTDVSTPEQTGVLLVAVAFLVATPTYGWYASLLVALIALSGRWEWLPLACAPTLVYLVRLGVTDHTRWSALCYLVAAVLSGALLLRQRYWPGGTDTAGAAGSGSESARRQIRR